MKKLIPLRVISPVIILLTLLLSACSPFNAQEKSALEWKRGLFQRLQNNLAEPVAARVQKMPPDMLKVIQDLDRSIGLGNPDQYAARMATAEELKVIKTYIDLLPNSYQTVFKNKLLAIYLVDDFSGAGFTDWVVDRNGQTYYYLVFSSSLLKVSLDDWLTYKDNSFFDKSITLPTIRVRTNTKYNALMYGLLHEGAHIVDCEFGVTPYVDPLLRKLNGRTQETAAFTENVWLQRTQPTVQYEYKHRGELNVYGSIPKKGLIPRFEVSEMFAQLSKTPFVTFYSGTSWNEDFADFMTYQLIEKRLGGTVSVNLSGEEKVFEHYEPFKTSQVQQREKFVRDFLN